MAITPPYKRALLGGIWNRESTMPSYSFCAQMFIQSSIHTFTPSKCPFIQKQNLFEHEVAHAVRSVVHNYTAKRLLSYINASIVANVCSTEQLCLEQVHSLLSSMASVSTLAIHDIVISVCSINSSSGFDGFGDMTNQSVHELICLQNDTRLATSIFEKLAELGHTVKEDPLRTAAVRNLAYVLVQEPSVNYLNKLHNSGIMNQTLYAMLSAKHLILASGRQRVYKTLSSFSIGDALPDTAKRVLWNVEHRSLTISALRTLLLDLFPIADFIIHVDVLVHSAEQASNKVSRVWHLPQSFSDEVFTYDRSHISKISVTVTLTAGIYCLRAQVGSNDAECEAVIDTLHTHLISQQMGRLFTAFLSTQQYDPHPCYTVYDTVNNMPVTLVINLPTESCVISHAQTALQLGHGDPDSAARIVLDNMICGGYGNLSSQVCMVDNRNLHQNITDIILGVIKIIATTSTSTTSTPHLVVSTPDDQDQKLDDHAETSSSQQDTTVAIIGSTIAAVVGLSLVVIVAVILIQRCVHDPLLIN